jgi:formylglycine-generating enzyme
MSVRRRLTGWAAVMALAACGSSQEMSGASDASDAAHRDGPVPMHHDASAAAKPDAYRHAIDGGSVDGARDADAGPCPAGMILVQSFCVDTWEAYVVELDDAGVEHPHSPYDVVDGLVVRAKTAPHVVPQGYISQIEATAACTLAGKRLCSEDEFHLACSGPDASNYYPYGGETDIPGFCNEGKGSYVELLYGSDPSTWTYADFNDPRLNQVDGGLAPTESYPHCRSPFGVYDCMGNLHEWGSDPPDVDGHGRFRGGFYGDAEENGPGCLYVTSAHDVSYHDYSTGFRCCADVDGGGP